MVKAKKVSGKDIPQVLPYPLEGGKVAPLVLVGDGVDSIVLNQGGDIVGIRAGDICRYGLEKALIVGFTGDDNFYFGSLLTRVYIMPKEKTQTFYGFGYWIIRYPGDYFDIINIEILKKTKSPMRIETTKSRMLYFLNS